jgi:hypothetical protein
MGHLLWRKSLLSGTKSWSITGGMAMHNDLHHISWRKDRRAWVVLIRRDRKYSPMIQKMFTTRQYGDKEVALQAAKEFRDRMIKEVPTAYMKEWRELHHIIYTTMGGREYFLVQIVINRKRYAKYFSIKKLGSSEALEEAKKFRDQILKLRQGDAYAC